MNDRYTFTLSIEHPNFGGHRAARIQVDTLSNRDILRAVDDVPDPMTAVMVGAPTRNKIEHIRAARARLAKEVAAALTEQILQTFGEKDTRNGYPR